MMHSQMVPMPPGRSRWSPATRSLPVTYTRVPPTGVCGGAGSRAGSSRYRPIFSPFADQPIHCAGAGLYRLYVARAGTGEQAKPCVDDRWRQVPVSIRAAARPRRCSASGEFSHKKSGPEAAFFCLWARVA